MGAGRMLILIGLALVAAGVVVLFAARFGIHLGRLPGDIRVERRHFGFYFPLTTCILLSVLLTLVMWLFRK